MAMLFLFVLAVFLTANGVCWRQNNDLMNSNVDTQSILNTADSGFGGRGRRANGVQDMSEFNETQISILIHVLNEARQNVMPQSSNMMTINWDQNLESKAQEWTRACDSGTPPSYSSDYFPFYYSTFNETADTQKAVEEFALFIEYMGASYNRTNNACGPCDACVTDPRFAHLTDEACESYLHIIRHNQTVFACDLHLCNSTLPSTYFINCVVPRLDDIYDGNESITLPYEIGMPCSECLSELPSCSATYSLCSGKVPACLTLVNESGLEMNPAGEPFTMQPSLTLLDDKGHVFCELANPACHWYVGVAFQMASNPHAYILGKLEVPVVQGMAVFEDLGISEPGEYMLHFYVSFPEEAKSEKFSVSSSLLMIGPPIVDNTGTCTVDEGEPRFERSYEWGGNCSRVCVRDCIEHHNMCVDLKSCGHHARCTESGCVCLSHYQFGYNIFALDQLANTILPEVRCMPGYIELRLNKCGMNALGYKLSDLYILGGDEWKIPYDQDINKHIHPFVESCVYNDCRGFVSANENGLWYSFVLQGNFADCHAEVESNETYITYRNKVRGYGGFGNAVISRKRPVEIEFSCTYITSITITTAIQPFISSATLQISSGGELDVNIGLWTDSSYQTPIREPPLVMVDDPIYIGILMEGVDTSHAKLYAEECHVTLTEDRNDSMRKDLIVGGCPAESAVIIAMNGDSDRVIFSFKSFVFEGHTLNTTLHVHCKVNICFNDTAPCTTSCVSRRRRTPSDSNDGLSTEISLGPITVQDRTSRESNVEHELYASSFGSEYAIQEVADPPFARTTGAGLVGIQFV